MSASPAIFTEPLLLFFIFLEKHASTFGNYILSETFSGGRAAAFRREALAILALLSFFSFLLVDDLHMK
jgi:hypothetical protein